MQREQKELKQLEKKTVITSFIFLYLPLFFLILIATIALFLVQLKSVKTELSGVEQQFLQGKKLLLVHQFNGIIEDILYVSDACRLLNIKDRDVNVAELKRLRLLYKSFLERRTYYERITWYNADGDEIVNVGFGEGEASIVPEEMLQKGVGTDTIDAALRLKPNELLVTTAFSPLASREKDQTYPTLTMSKAVFNSTGEVTGAVVLQCTGKNIFSALVDESAQTSGIVMLLENDSAWIVAPDKLREETPRAANDDFHSTMDTVWHLIEDKDSGIVTEGGETYVFTSVYPLRNKGFTPDSLSASEIIITSGKKQFGDYHWVLLSLIPGHVIAGEMRAFSLVLFPAAFLFSGGFALAAYRISRARGKRILIEQQYKEEAAIYNKNPAPVIRTALSGAIVRYNAAAARLFPTDVLQKSVFKLFSNLRKNGIQSILTNNSFQFEEKIGNRFYLFTAKRDDPNQSILFFGSDITAFKQMEDELHKLSLAVEQSANVVVITDTDGNIVFANRAFETTTGYTRQEALNGNPRILKSGNQPSSFYRELWETISIGTIWQGEFLNKRKDGSEYWEKAVISPIKNDRGEIINYLAVKEDITGTRQAAEELKIAKEEAEAANRLKSEFLANMSHEIRTPMNAILGFTDILLDEETETDRRDSLEAIKSSGKNLLNLINDILDLSKIEAGKINIEKENCNLRSLLEQNKAVFEETAGEKRLEFTVTVEESVPEIVVGDENKINQILLNLLSNAFKFTEHGAVSVYCSYDPEKEQACITVRDTGIGIPSEKQNIIFSAFEQADTSTVREYGGTGLGLAISKRLAEMMDGNITVTSSTGKGALFIVQLHLPAREHDNRQSAASAKVIPDGETMVKRWIEGMRGEEDMVAILFEGLRDLPEKLTKLEKAVDGDRQKDIAFFSHDLKGLAGNLGMREIYEAAARLNTEATGAEYDREKIKISFNELSHLLEIIPDEYLLELQEDDKTSVPQFNILVAEDNVVNQKLIKALLKTMRLHPTVVSNGRKALRALQSESFDLLLLDMQMPVLNGEETVKQVRADNQLKDLHIIALTAHALEGDAERYINIGCDDYISKPIDREILKEKINRRIVRKTETVSAIGVHNALTGNDKERLIRIVDALKKNISIFNPGKVSALAEDLASIDGNTRFDNVAEELRRTAENFDDEELARIVSTLSQYI